MCSAHNYTHNECVVYQNARQLYLILLVIGKQLTTKGITKTIRPEQWLWKFLYKAYRYCSSDISIAHFTSSSGHGGWVRKYLYRYCSSHISMAHFKSSSSRCGGRGPELWAMGKNNISRIPSAPTWWYEWYSCEVQLVVVLSLLENCPPHESCSLFIYYRCCLLLYMGITESVFMAEDSRPLVQAVGHAIYRLGFL